MPRKEDKKLRKQYRDLFGQKCEVIPHMPPADLAKARSLGRLNHLEINHIFSRGGRSDTWSNMIVIDPVIHKNWGHDFNPRELRIVCLYSKWMKSRGIKSRTNPYPEREFDLDQLNAAAGKRVLGLLEIYQSELPEHSDYWQMCKIITESH